MKYIEKTQTPIAFEYWKNAEQPNSWSHLPSRPIKKEDKKSGINYYSKQELREELITEQNGTCCYCECSIQNNYKTSIEHLEPRIGDTNTERIFDYFNLMASCNGGQKDNKPRLLHCDPAKGMKTIPISPLDKRCEKELSFTIEGKIIGSTTDAEKTIDILNLDIPKLNNLRENAIAGFIFKDIDKTDYLSPSDCELIYQKIESTPNEPYRASILAALRQIKNSSFK